MLNFLKQTKERVGKTAKLIGDMLKWKPVIPEPKSIGDIFGTRTSEPRGMTFEVGKGLTEQQRQQAEQKLQEIRRVPTLPRFSVLAREREIKRLEKETDKTAKKIYEELYPERADKLKFALLTGVYNPKEISQAVEEGKITPFEVEMFTPPRVEPVIGGMQIQFSGKAKALISGAKGAGVTKADILKPQALTGAKKDAYRALTAEPTIKAELQRVVKDPNVPVTQKIGELLERVIRPEVAKDPLIQEARKYKSAEELNKFRSYEKEAFTEAGIDITKKQFITEKVKPSDILDILTPQEKADVLSKVGRLGESKSVPLLLKTKDGYRVMDGGHALANALKENKPITIAKSQLTDIYNQATQPTKGVEALAEEARKYKSAEEFVNSQKIYYRATEDGKTLGTGEKWAWTDKKTAESWAKRNNVKVVEFTVSDEGIDPIDLSRIKSKTGTDRFKFDTSKAQTKSQLIDIWNKANETPTIETGKPLKEAKEELITIYRGQDEPIFSLEPRKGKAHNMMGNSFTRNKEIAEMYSLSGKGLYPTVIEGTIPKSKIMTFDKLSPRMRERFRKEISKMEDDDIISGELIENIMDEVIPIAKHFDYEAVDMTGFTRGLVDEIRVVDSAKTFKLLSKTDRSDLLEKFKAKSKIEERWNKAHEKPTLIQEAKKYKPTKPITKDEIDFAKERYDIDLTKYNPEEARKMADDLANIAFFETEFEDSIIKGRASKELKDAMKDYLDPKKTTVETAKIKLDYLEEMQRYAEKPGMIGNRLKSFQEQFKKIKLQEAKPAQEKPTIPTFQGYKDLTTKFLESIKGKQTLSRQEIEGFARRPEIKKAEADLLLKKLEEFEPKKITEPIDTKEKLFTTNEQTKNKGIQLLTKSFGDKESAIIHAEQYWAKEGKPGVFHHATKEESPFGLFEKEKAANMNIGLRRGVSNVNGLYVGRDPKALHEFYNMAAERGENIITYKGNPKLLDLTDEDTMRKFTNKFKTGDQIEKELSRGGYDGIKYFDPYATGEEIVITNQNILEPVAFNGKPINLPSKIPAQDFADSIKRDLLPLTAVKVKDPQYQNITIEPGGARINLKTGERTRGNYEEVVFESPIETNGSSHYPNSKNYLAHARGDEVSEGGKKIWREQEIQSDVLQKEGLERLRQVFPGRPAYGITSSQRVLKEVEKLEPFTNDRYGERILKERLKEKAQKGYEAYRFPTGQTIGKIEGFAENRQWGITGQHGSQLRIEDLKVGKEVFNRGMQGDWIITDVLGDGRFKAAPIKVFYKDFDATTQREIIDTIADLKNPALDDDEGIQIMKELLNEETFDLTGKSNPQFIRYEKWGKFLKNRYGAKQITDKQGNTWYEVPITSEMKDNPVEAFGMMAGIEAEEDEEGNLTLSYNPMSGALGVAGLGIRRLKPAQIKQVSQLAKKGLTPDKISRATGLKLQTIETFLKGGVSQLTPRQEELSKRFYDDRKEFGIGLEAQKRGVIPWPQTEKLAEGIMIDIRKLSELKKGTVFNAETLERAMQELRGWKAKVKQLKDNHLAKPEDTEIKRRYEEARDLLNRATINLIAVESEMGRALGAVRYDGTIEKLTTNIHKNLKETMRRLDDLGKTRLQNLIDNLDKDDPDKVRDFLIKYNDASFIEKVVEYYKSSLYSALTTQAFNATASGLMMATDIPIRATAGGFDLLRSTISRTPREVYTAEAFRMITSGITSLRVAAIEALKSLAKEGHRGGARALSKEGIKIPAIKGTLGKAVRSPFRLASAIDNFERTIKVAQEIDAMAYRLAKKEGHKGLNLVQRTEQIKADPPTQLIETATEKAERVMGYEELRGILDFVNKGRFAHPGVQLVIPFYRAIVNFSFIEAYRLTPGRAITTPIKRRMGEIRVPLIEETTPWFEKMKISAKKMVAKEMKPDPLMENPLTRPEEYGRMIFGVGVATTFLLALMSERMEVTGPAPRGEKEKSTFYGVGKKPYSFRIKKPGGEWSNWYEYRRMQPYATILFTMHQINEYINMAKENPEKLNPDEMEDKTIQFANQWIKFVFTEQAAMQGVSNLISAFEGGMYNEGQISAAARFLRNQAGGFVPNILFSATRSIDPTIYLTNNFTEEFAKRVPGGPQWAELIPRRDPFGMEVGRGETAMSRFLNPYRYSEETNDPVFMEIERLSIGVGYPSKSVAGQTLTNEEYDTYLRDYGPRLKLELDKLMKSDEYKNATELKKIEVINNRVAIFRERSRNALFKDYYDMQKREQQYIQRGISPNEAWEKAREDFGYNKEAMIKKVEETYLRGEHFKEWDKNNNYRR